MMRVRAHRAAHRSGGLHERAGSAIRPATNDDGRLEETARPESTARGARRFGGVLTRSSATCTIAASSTAPCSLRTAGTWCGSVDSATPGSTRKPVHGGHSGERRVARQDMSRPPASRFRRPPARDSTASIRMARRRIVRQMVAARHLMNGNVSRCRTSFSRAQWSPGRVRFHRRGNPQVGQRD